MKKIEIVKIYDASNSDETEHLIDKEVIFSNNLKSLYRLSLTGIYNGFSCEPSSYSVFIVRTNREIFACTYIAEFREVG